MQKNKNLIVFLVAMLPIVFMVISLRLFRRNHPGGGGITAGIPGQSSQPVRPALYTLERLAKWKAAEFVPLTNDETVRTAVGVLDFHLGETLDNDQLVGLTNAAVDLISAFQNGSFESYTKFRIPVKTFYFATGISNAMQKRYSIPAQTIRDNPETAWKQYFEAVVNSRFSNYWVGVSLTNSYVQVERSLSGTNDLLYSLMTGSPTFTIDSLRDVKLLADRFRVEPSAGTIDAYVKSALSSNTLSILLSGKDGLDEIRRPVVDDLNKLIQKGSIYDPKLFQNVNLSPQTQDLLRQNPAGADLIRLNRLLLVDAFPRILGRATWVDNVGMSGRRPSVLIEPSRAEVLKADGFVEVATVRILAKPRGNDPVYPVYMRWYWSPKDKKWLPEQLVAMYSGRGRTELFF